MEMVTVHELSRMLDITDGALRRRLHQLIQDGKFVEGRDYLREGYIDETHFTWKISPDAFIRETGHRKVPTPSSPLAGEAASGANERLNPPASAVNHSVGRVSQVTSEPTYQPPTPVSAPRPEPTQTLPKVDSSAPSLEREMIDLLKGQIVVKDGQIADLTAQNNTVVALNEKLTGVVVHHAEQIKELLQLTDGRTPAASKMASEVRTRATGSANEAATDANDTASAAETHAA